MIQVYGMSGCTTVRNAQRWLSDQGVDHRYQHYGKVENLAQTLQDLIDASTLTTVLNVNSQAYRKLDAQDQQRLVQDRDSAVAAMLANPRLIKRPIATAGSTLLAGFDADDWARAFLAK